MIKKTAIFFMAFALLLQLANAQETINAKLDKQSNNELIFSYQLDGDSYQELNLNIEKNTIQYFNRSSFISVLSMIDKEEVELARFYLSEYANGEEQNDSQFSKKTIYDFDVCLWQKVLKEQGEITLKTDGSFDNSDIKVYFTGILGKPSISVKEIIPLWKSDTEGFVYTKEGIDKKDLPTQKIKLDAEVQNGFIQVLVHGIEKTKNPSSRFYFLNVNGKEIAKRSIWRDDCAYNPIYPQSTNWFESRPNWCPGLRIYPLRHHISEEFFEQDQLQIDLRFQQDIMENSGIYSYVVSAVFFVLDKPEKEVNVGITEILSPNIDQWHQRYNPICGSPVLIIKNLGQENLKQVTINYGYNFQTDNKYRWKGDLGFLEEDIVYLPPLNWYFFEKDDEPESFTAVISSANEKEDAYPRGKKTTKMELADVYPYRLTFQLRTDKEAIDNALEIFDDNGNPYFISGELSADTSYLFHVNFVPGCYEMILFDQKGNGIENWKENLPVLEIIDQKNGTKLKSFDGNFGGEIREQFMIFR